MSSDATSHPPSGNRYWNTRPTRCHDCRIFPGVPRIWRSAPISSPFLGSRVLIAAIYRAARPIWMRQSQGTGFGREAGSGFLGCCGATRGERPASIPFRTICRQGRAGFCLGHICREDSISSGGRHSTVVKAWRGPGGAGPEGKSFGRNPRKALQELGTQINRRERRIKGWLRAKKEAMMGGDILRLYLRAPSGRKRLRTEKAIPPPSRRRFAPVCSRPLPLRSQPEPRCSQWNLGLPSALDERS